MGRNTPAAPAAETPAAIASLANAPIIVAATALAAAVAAVARFPNQPVPASLVDRITVAQRAFEEAVNGFTLTLPEGDGGYDDKWVREEFDKLAEGLKSQFDKIGEQFREASETRLDSARLIDERFKTLEGRLSAAEAAAKSAEERALAAEKAAAKTSKPAEG